MSGRSSLQFHFSHCLVLATHTLVYFLDIQSLIPINISLCSNLSCHLLPLGVLRKKRNETIILSGILSCLSTSVSLVLSAVLPSDFSFQAPEPRRVCHVLSVEQSKDIQPSLTACTLLEIDSWCLVMFQQNHRLGIGLLNQETTCLCFFLHGAESFYLHCCCAWRGCILQSAKRKSCNEADYLQSEKKSVI